MPPYQYKNLRDCPSNTDIAAEWFSSKWKIPKEAYLECMNAYLKKKKRSLAGIFA